MRVWQPVKSLFGLTDEEGGEGEEEDTITDSKDLAGLMAKFPG